MTAKAATFPFAEFLIRLFATGVLLLGMLAIAAIPALGQTVYYHGPQPIVVYPPQTVVGQGPIIVQVIDPPAPPPAVTVQVVSPSVPSAITAPPAVVQAPMPVVPPAASVAVSGGISNVCVSCSNVTQTINVTKRVRTRPATVSKTPAPKPVPASSTPPSPATSGANRDDWWLIPLLLALLGGLLLALLGWRLGCSRRPRVYPAPPVAPAVPAPPAAAPAAVSPVVNPPAADPGMVTVPLVMRVEAEPVIIGLNPAVRRPRAPARPASTPAPAPAAPPRVRTTPARS